MLLPQSIEYSMLFISVILLYDKGFLVAFPLRISNALPLSRPSSRPPFPPLLSSALSLHPSPRSIPKPRGSKVVAFELIPQMLCRSLVIDGSDMGFLDLADVSLRSLSIEYNIADDDNQFTDLARLTQLTRLELKDFHDTPPLTALSQLPIEELVLLSCWLQAVEELLVPGSLRALRKLHIEHRPGINPCTTSSGLAQTVIQQRQQEQRTAFREALFQRPEFCQISGVGGLWAFGLQPEQDGWQKSSLPRGRMVTLEEDCPTSPEIDVWSKLGSQ